MVQETIEAHLPEAQFEILKAAETSEREIIGRRGVDPWPTVMTAAAVLLRLLDPSTSLERAWNEMNSRAVTEGRAAFAQLHSSVPPRWYRSHSRPAEGGEGVAYGS
jgi:hypothetical protein